MIDLKSIEVTVTLGTPEKALGTRKIRVPKEFWDWNSLERTRLLDNQFGANRWRAVLR